MRVHNNVHHELLMTIQYYIITITLFIGTLTEQHLKLGLRATELVAYGISSPVSMVTVPGVVPTDDGSFFLFKVGETELLGGFSFFIFTLLVSTPPVKTLSSC